MDLPILPDHWKHNVSSSTKKQFDVLKKLLNDSRADTDICATDAGREGEFIFRLVYEKANCKSLSKSFGLSLIGEKLIDKAQVVTVLKSCDGQEVIIESVEQKKKRKSPRSSTTLLPCSTNKPLGFTAEQTSYSMHRAFMKRNTSPIPERTADF